MSFQSKSGGSLDLLPCHIPWQQPGTLAAAGCDSPAEPCRQSCPGTAAPGIPPCPGETQLSHSEVDGVVFGGVKSRNALFKEGSVSFKAQSLEHWCLKAAALMC